MTRGWKVERIVKDKEKCLEIWRVWDPKCEGWLYIVQQDCELTFIEEVEEE